MFNADTRRKMRHILFAEAFQTVTKSCGLVLHELNGVINSRDENQSGEMLDFVKNLRAWGRSFAVKVKNKTSPKIYNEGVHCMMVRCSEKNNADMHRIFCPPSCFVSAYEVMLSIALEDA